ncbi:hypothetical protein J659_0651, partial [Acinetobacter baumannii 1406589]
YKIKVKDEAESKEAQELFFELGYKKECFVPAGYPRWIATTDSGEDYWYSTGFDSVSLLEGFKELTLPQLRDLVAQSKLKAQGLISGAEAMIAALDDQEVEYRWVDGSCNWRPFNDEDWSVEDLKSGTYSFRLKPQTIKLELELPKPFEPEEDCHVYILDDGKTDGYRRYFYEVHGDKGNEFIGIWKTEDEIKQVVEQLRKIRGTNS